MARWMGCISRRKVEKAVPQCRKEWFPPPRKSPHLEGHHTAQDTGQDDAFSGHSPADQKRPYQSASHKAAVKSHVPHIGSQRQQAPVPKSQALEHQHPDQGQKAPQGPTTAARSMPPHRWPEEPVPGMAKFSIWAANTKAPSTPISGTRAGSSLFLLSGPPDRPRSLKVRTSPRLFREKGVHPPYAWVSPPFGQPGPGLPAPAAKLPASCGRYGYTIPSWIPLPDTAGFPFLR